jgi:DNA-binding response OmpR family regulator
LLPYEWKTGSEKFRYVFEFYSQVQNDQYEMLELFGQSFTSNTKSAIGQLFAEIRRQGDEPRRSETILDREIRDGYGLELIPEIARAGSRCLIISPRNDVQDRVRALKMGAHDYIGKPIDIEEVYLRVNNIITCCGRCSDDDSRHILDLQGVKIDLTKRVSIESKRYAWSEVLKRANSRCCAVWQII